MGIRANIIKATAPLAAETGTTDPQSATRLLLIAGIVLIVTGMVFGDVFAIFALHQNAGRIGLELSAAARAAAGGDTAATAARFQSIGSLLENRGTKVDAHAHVIAFGYLALLLAVMQPFVALNARWKRQWAKVFVAGACLLPVGVFLIHYVGLVYSPMTSIGWASLIADFGGVLVLLAVVTQGVGFWRWSRTKSRAAEPLTDRGWSTRALLSGGSLLILAGFAYGAWYSYFDLYQAERANHHVLARMLDSAGAGDNNGAQAAANDYGVLQADMAVKIAAHSHVIEFGLLAMLLGFVQPLVHLSEVWKRRWAVVLLIGSVVLPVFVRLELWLGLRAGGIADAGGLLVIVALTAMLAGIFRNSSTHHRHGVRV